MRFIVDYLRTPYWRRQLQWRRAIWRNLSRLGLTGIHALPMNRRWVDIRWLDMPLPHLDPAMAGLKVVQISDLHFSPVVWSRYLIQYIRWINTLSPDLVVVTGDLITGGYRYAHRVAQLLSHIQSRHGVICTLGNHDYSMYGRNMPTEGRRRADYLVKSLRQRGLMVLRNETFEWTAPGAARGVQIVGLDDEWTGAIDPPRAFAGINPDSPIICLNHNPANVLSLMDYPWQWMLSGHTHGRAIGVSPMGKRFMGHRFRHYTRGYYAVQGRHLYVNRGLCYGQRTMDWARPEITIFKIKAADSVSTQPPTITESTVDVDPRTL